MPKHQRTRRPTRAYSPPVSKVSASGTPARGAPATKNARASKQGGTAITRKLYNSVDTSSSPGPSRLPVSSSMPGPSTIVIDNSQISEQSDLNSHIPGPSRPPTSGSVPDHSMINENTQISEQLNDLSVLILSMKADVEKRLSALENKDQCSSHPAPVQTQRDATFYADPMELDFRGTNDNFNRNIAANVSTHHMSSPNVNTHLHHNMSPINVNHNFISSPIPIGLHLKPNTRTLIGEGKFVEFSTLLTQREDPQEAIITIDAGGEQKILIAGGGSNQKTKPLSWNDWCAAWNVYQAVFAEMRGDPTLPARLAKHFQTVQMLERKGLDWRHYDRSFRQLVSGGHAHWGHVHQELFGEVHMRAAAGPSRQGLAQSIPVSSYPMGYCRNYHRNTYCSRQSCQYLHKCFNCQGNHPFISCQFPVVQPFRANPASLQANNTRSFQPRPQFGNPQIPPSSGPTFNRGNGGNFNRQAKNNQ